MHIVYVTETYPPEVNGVSLTVARTVAYLRERGHVVRLIRPRLPDEEARDDEDEWLTAGAPIPLYSELRFGLALPGSVQRRIAGFDLLHLATPGPLAWAALHAARSLDLATSSDFRTNFHQYTRHYGLHGIASGVLSALKAFHNGTDCTFVPTRQACVELSNQGFKHLEVIGRGVDIDRFDPQRRSPSLRAAWGAGDADPVLLHVGRLAPEKNVGLALRAFDRVLRRHPGARMVLVGDGPARKALEAAHPHACFVGMKTGAELAACYASADLFVFPSLSETFGNVTLEALASGLPVVAFDAAAAGQYVRHRVNGLLAAPGNEEDFVADVVSLSTAPQRRAAMREPARETARGVQWDEVLGRFEQRLQSVAFARSAADIGAALHD